MSYFLLQAERELVRRMGTDAKLRTLQVEVLKYLSERRNVFASLPTGYGKSLCFWLPSAAWNWRVVVVSPLLALIEDQRMAAEKLGLDPTTVHSGQTPEIRRKNEEKFLFGESKILFLTPERLVSWSEPGSPFARALTSIDLLVLDEMHCLEEWRSFRTGYEQLFAAIKRHLARDARLLGLSASMAIRESRAWMTELCDDAIFVQGGLGRPNLSLFVIPLEEEKERWILLLSALRELSFPETALVYCSTRAEVDEVTRWLGSVGIPCAAYHAGIPASVRAARSEAFRRGDLRVVCATTAFGMGVDYPRVGRVIHFSMPYNLESYWQEAGRAGRDGSEAASVAFWLRSEILRSRILDKPAKERFVSIWQNWLEKKCRKQQIAAQLGWDEIPCGKCDVCQNGLDAEKVFPWMQGWNLWRRKKVWWMEKSAESKYWVKEKIFSTDKIS